MWQNMIDSIIFDESGDIQLTLLNTAACTLASIVIGFVIALIYMYTVRKYSKDYVITLMLLPILVQTIIMLVNGNLGTGVAVMGAFSLVRFRSLPGNAREIGMIFFAMSTGLATGMGYITYAVCMTVIVGILLLIVCNTNFGNPRVPVKKLRVTIPEDLDYDNIFNDLFEKYTKTAELENVKTVNLGSLFTLTYDITLKDEHLEKEFIDEIRCRNGNLTVVIGRELNDKTL